MSDVCQGGSRVPHSKMRLPFNGVPGTSIVAISTLPGIRGSSWTFEVHSMPPTWRRHATLYLHSPAKSTDLNGLMYKCKACFHNVAPFKSQRSEPFLEPC